MTFLNECPLLVREDHTWMPFRRAKVSLLVGSDWLHMACIHRRLTYAITRVNRFTKVNWFSAHLSSITNITCAFWQIVPIYNRKGSYNNYKCIGCPIWKIVAHDLIAHQYRYLAIRLHMILLAVKAMVAFTTLQRMTLVHRWILVQNMAGEIFVHACHILKRAETCLVASQNIYHWMNRLSPRT